MSRSNHRRLFAASVLFISLAIGGRVHAADSIALENAKPGTTAWQLTNPVSLPSLNSTIASVYATPEIQGYASGTSVNQGETINFYVRTTNTNSYSLSIYRLGWYGGSGGRLMQAPVTLTGVVQSMPPPPVFQPVGTGLVECNWKASYSLAIPNEWVSGIYLVKLSLSVPAKESYIIFVVRDDARNSPILYQASFATYQAYNEWGGSSLYTRTGNDAQTGPRTGVKVSFDRPFWRNLGTGDFLNYEIRMVRWLERQGYDVTYATDLDTHQNPDLLLSHKVFLIVGHDEYWSWNMRDNVERGRDAGVHLGFLGANICYVQVRFEPGGTGTPDRTMVGYNAELAALDPVSDPRFLTTLWRNIRPEGAMIGVDYSGVSDLTPSDIVVTDASHWLFNGAGLNNGSILPNVLGYETDSLSVDRPVGTISVAHSPFPKGAPRVFSDVALYTAASGANVFAAGSIYWSRGLDDYSSSFPVVPAVQQVTANFLSRALQSSPLPFSVTVSSLPGGTVGVAYTSALAATGGATPYSWSIASGTLPSGLTLSSAGVISGTPGASGSFSFTAAVTDSSSPAQRASQTLTLSVAATPPPAVGRLGATVTTSSAATGYPASYAGDGNTTTQWVASLNGNDSNNNNSWIRLDFGARVSLQSVKWHGAGGSPYPAWSPTNYSIQVSDDGITWQTVVTRSNGSPVVDGSELFNAQARFARMLTSKVGDGTGWSLSFFEFWAEGSTSTQPPSPLSIASSTLPPGTVGRAYDATLAAMGGTVPYVWSIASGALPPGLALGTSGRIAGTPSTTGNFTLTFQVSDSGAPTQSAIGSFTISVALAPLAIATTSLAGGTVGVAYNSALAATGGATPYAWSIASGALPAGLTLSSAGVISGTPSQSGTLSFTAAVTDSSSPAGTATKALSLSVAAVPLPSGRLQTFATNGSSAASGYPAARATDLNANTSWVASLDGTKSSNNNAWLQWDLGSTKQIDRVKWTGAVGSPYPAFSPTNYYIQVSDDAVSWRTIVTRSNASAVINGNEAMNAQGRHVRFTSTKVNDGTGWSLGFFEIWAEGR